MFERIIVPLDGSSLGEAVLGQVRRVLFHKDAEVVLVRAVAVPPSLEGMSMELPEILKAQAMKYLEKIGKLLVDQGARVRSYVRIGHAADVILDLAAEERASMILMSTHGKTGLSRWAFGSSTEKVLRASRIPVMAIRSFTDAGQNSPPTELDLKRILVPVDSADASLEVVAPALELAKLFGSQVALVHVCDGPNCPIPVPQLTRAYDLFRAEGISVEPLMKQGDPAVQILETCLEQKSDLIAMTTHGRAGITRWMMGSVTEKVLRASRVPLLIVRPAKTPAALAPQDRKVQVSPV